MSHGPYLYDEDPAPLHTGRSRRRRGLLIGIFGGTVAAAVGMAVLLPSVNGSPDEQAREVTGVFLQAVQKGDTETAYGLLCEEERNRLPPERVVSYVHPGGGQVVGISGDRRDERRVELVDVRWTDGGASRFTVVNEGGPRICGTHPVG